MLFFDERNFVGRTVLCDNLFLCNKFLKLQSYNFYLMTSSMDKKETPPYRVSVGYINCESAYRATVSRRRKCRWFWPESWHTSHSRCRHTINPFVASSRSIVSGTFRDTSLKVVPARVERWIFSASNKTKIYLPRLTPLSKLWTKVTQRIVFDNIYFRIDFNAYELFRKINYFSKYEKLWRKTQIREYPFDNYFIEIASSILIIVYSSNNALELFYKASGNLSKD